MARIDDNARGADAGPLAVLAAAAARRDPLPGHLVSFAQAAYGWRGIDAELAELLHDSLLTDDALLAGVRGSAELRLLEFAAPGLRVELEIEHDRTLIVQLVPPVAAVVELHDGERTRRGRADALGRCVLDRAPSGPVSLRIIPDGAQAAIVTPWLTL